MIPTPLAIQTFTPALSPKPGLPQITKVFLLSGVFLIYILSGKATASMYLVQDYASSEMQNILWSLWRSPVGTRVVNFPNLPSLRLYPRNLRILVDLSLSVFPIMSSTSLLSISPLASSGLSISLCKSKTLIEKILAFRAHKESQNYSEFLAFQKSASIPEGRDTHSSIYLAFNCLDISLDLRFGMVFLNQNLPSLIFLYMSNDNLFAILSPRKFSSRNLKSAANFFSYSSIFLQRL